MSKGNFQKRLWHDLDWWSINISTSVRTCSPGPCGMRKGCPCHGETPSSILQLWQALVTTIPQTRNALNVFPRLFLDGRYDGQDFLRRRKQQKLVRSDHRLRRARVVKRGRWKHPWYRKSTSDASLDGPPCAGRVGMGNLQIRRGSRAYRTLTSFTEKMIALHRARTEGNCAGKVGSATRRSLRGQFNSAASCCLESCRCRLLRSEKTLSDDSGRILFKYSNNESQGSLVVDPLGMDPTALGRGAQDPPKRGVVYTSFTFSRG